MPNSSRTVYDIGPFHLDVEKSVLLKEGKDVGLRSQPFALLRFLVEHPDEALSYSQLAAGAWGAGVTVETHVVIQTASVIKKALGKQYGKYIKNRRRNGYTFRRKALQDDTQAAEIGSVKIRSEVDACPKFAVNPEIAAVLDRQSLALESIDEYIEFESLPTGWRQKEVEFRYVGLYEPPDEFACLIRRFEAAPPLRQYYSLHDVESRVSDEERRLIVYVQGGDWRHIHALNEAAKNDKTDKDCRHFRERCERDLMPGPTSRLYRNVNCEILVVSSDKQIVLGRRRVAPRSGHGVPFSPGAWSTTLEEQVLRRDPDGKTNPDTDLFSCAQRGVEEELRVEIDPEATRLLSYGVEWRNFTAAFLFLVKTRVDFETITRKWRHAGDRIEAIALDCMSARKDTIRAALERESWSPSKRARTWKGRDAIAVDVWHPTARARLCAYLRHIS